MRFRTLLCLLALSATACTISPDKNGANAQFHPPLTSPSWTVSYYRLPSGVKACAISSGYNALTFRLGAFPGGIETEAESNRRMEPGATLTVNANSSTFRAYDAFFPAKTAAAMAENFTHGGKAYVEWYEVSGPSGQERIHIQNIVALDDFSPKLNECRTAIAHP